MCKFDDAHGGWSVGYVSGQLIAERTKVQAYGRDGSKIEKMLKNFEITYEGVVPNSSPWEYGRNARKKVIRGICIRGEILTYPRIPEGL